MLGVAHNLVPASLEIEASLFCGINLHVVCNFAVVKSHDSPSFLQVTTLSQGYTATGGCLDFTINRGVLQHGHGHKMKE